MAQEIRAHRERERERFCTTGLPFPQESYSRMIQVNENLLRVGLVFTPREGGEGYKRNHVV